MKSLVTTFLLFATCLVVAGTIALIDQAQATLAASSDTMEVARTELAAAADAPTLSEFANSVQEKFALPQPDAPVVFDDVPQSNPSYTAAEAVYPFLHRQLLCPDCALTPNFYPKAQLTRAQAAVVLVSILIRAGKITLATPEETSDILANVPDADSVSVFARPYIATAVANGLLRLEPGNLIRPSQPYSHTEMAAIFDTVQRRFPPPPATAYLRLPSRAGR
jgi:S-layer homology domain